MENYEPSKVLVKGDLERFMVTGEMMRLIRPNFEAEQNEAAFQVVDWRGMFWEFRCTRRAVGPYEKPTLQAREWGAFVRHAGLQVGDKITVRRHADKFRGTSFKIIAQRKQGNGIYMDI